MMVSVIDEDVVLATYCWCGCVLGKCEDFSLLYESWLCNWVGDIENRNILVENITILLLLFLSPI